MRGKGETILRNFTKVWHRQAKNLTKRCMCHIKSNKHPDQVDKVINSIQKRCNVSLINFQGKNLTKLYLCILSAKKWWFQNIHIVCRLIDKDKAENANGNEEHWEQRHFLSLHNFITSNNNGGCSWLTDSGSLDMGTDYLSKIVFLRHFASTSWAVFCVSLRQL